MANLFAVLVLMCALVFIGMAVWTLRRARTTVSPITPEKTSHIIAHGIFAVSRNPIYVGMLMLIVAVGLYWQHTGFVVFVAIAWAYLQRFQILPEERHLLAKFSDEYSAYQKKVPRWF
jgi:protein-S-isoprenylcysteine O-methyltransferase Ste14